MDLPQDDAKGLSEKQLSQCKEILRAHPLFTTIPQYLIDELLQSFLAQTFTAETTVVKENDFVDSIFFIAKGQAEVRKDNMPIAVLRKKESIGLSETGFYSSSGKRTATVIALTDLILFRLDIVKLNAFLKKNPQLQTLFHSNSKLMLHMNFIKQIAPFAAISVDNLYWLAQQVKEINLPANAILFTQNDAAEECFLLNHGQIEILLKDAKGSYRQLAVLTAPALLGEVALLTQSKRNATAKTLDPCELLVISRSALMKVMQEESTAAEAIIALMSLRTRPKRHPNIESYPQHTADQQDFIILKDRDNKKYFRLTPAGWFIWQKLDGTQTLRDLTMALFIEREIFNPPWVSSLIVELKQAGFIEMEDKQDAAVETKKLSFWPRAFIKLKNIMEAKYAFENVDIWVTKSYNAGVKFLFTKLGLAIQAIIVILGFIAFIDIFADSITLMQSSHLARWLFIISIPILMVIMIFHELAHAYTTKFFGHKVLGFGIGWLWVGPMAFCDTSDMWLSTRGPRVAVDVAGFVLQLVLAGMAALIAFFSSNTSMILIFWYIALFNYLAIFSNLSPLIELDGYYILMDILDRPKLKEAAVKWFAQDFLKELPHPQLMWRQHKAEVTYWVLTMVYMILDFIIPFVVLRYLLRGLFGITNPLFSLVISLAIVLLSALGIWSEIKRQRQLK